MQWNDSGLPTDVDLNRLAIVWASGVPVPLPSKPEPAPAPKNTMPWVIGGAGATLAAVGGVFGVLALTNYHSADRACPEHVDCSPDAIAERDRAGTFANVANVGDCAAVARSSIAALALWCSPETAEGECLTRGGSYASNDSTLECGSTVRLLRRSAAPTLGFRCCAEPRGSAPLTAQPPPRSNP
jgi:hypothetical protein